MRRREFLVAAASASCLAAPAWPADFARNVATFLENHRRGEAGYGWESDEDPQLTPTFAAVGCYRLLGLPIPNAKRVAEFVRTNYPVPERRRQERPLWRFDFEQVQALIWLGEPTARFVPLASTWLGPAPFTKAYELGGNPVFQHQAMAVCCRGLLGIGGADENKAWREYLLARRRTNGTFNNTPAADGSDGHVMNTLWGLRALAALHVELAPPPELIRWLESCQLPGGGFTYQPGKPLAGVDDVAYTWAAVHALRICGAKPVDEKSCAAYLEGLFTAEGGFLDREGGRPNPLATYYALDAMDALGRRPSAGRARAKSAPGGALPAGLDVFTIQIEAPGRGSPRDAVTLAESLGIHIWAAKNADAGWIAEARRVARERGANVLFAVGDEEYGTYISLPGLGTYSHLVDLVAPADRDSGKQMPRKQHPYPWAEFRDTRIASLKRGGGRMIWQFNENEELTRVLLDEACQSGTYAAIATFHFGNENFLHSQPFLHRWYGRLPFIALQDAHAAESWWWSDQLEGFRTLFLAKEPTWAGWLEALERNWVMSVRHDAITNGQTRLAGGSAPVRDYMMRRQDRWRWWQSPGVRRPRTAMALLRPGTAFEAGAPEEGIALRVRLMSGNTTQGAPKEASVTLVKLEVDGAPVATEPVEVRNPRGAVSDRYLLARWKGQAEPRKATLLLREIATGREETVSVTFSRP